MGFQLAEVINKNSDIDKLVSARVCNKFNTGVEE